MKTDGAPLVLLVRGKSLPTEIDLLKLGSQCVEPVTSPAALHVVVRKGV